MKKISNDAREKYPKPPFPQGIMKYSGTENTMNPRPDYGQESYHASGKLTEKVALITGGDSGIGRAVAVAYAKEGANVVIAYQSSDEDAKTTIDVIESLGKKGLAIKGDIREEMHCQSLVDKTIETFGRLDILVNNAAFQMFHKSFLEISSEEFDRAFKTNVYGMFYLCKAGLPRMQKGGAIINTASVQAFHPSASLLHYAATKGAIVTFTKALAQEAVQYGVRVNAVAPGPVWTPLIPATSQDDESVAQFGKQSLWGRPAQPVELSPVYVLLASDEGSYITGEIYPVTGSINVI